MPLLPRPCGKTTKSGWRAAKRSVRKKEPKLPVTPEKYPRGFFQTLYRDISLALAGYPIQGILWYQGETNTQRAGAYRELLTALIQSWRGAWQKPELPFLIVQLPEFNSAPSGKPMGLKNWPVIREKQAPGGRAKCRGRAGGNVGRGRSRTPPSAQ